MKTVALNSPFTRPANADPPAKHQSVDYGTRIWSGFALALASLVLVGVVGIRTTDALINRDGWVIHTRIVIDQLRALGLSIEALHGDLLSYAATRDDRYLHLAQIQSGTLDGAGERIRELVVDNSSQSRRAADLAVLLKARVKFAQRTIAVAGEGNFPTAAARTLGSGLAMSDELVRQVAAMSATENVLLAAREAAAAAAGEEALALITVGSLLGVFFVGLAGVFIRRSLAALRTRNQELAHSEHQMRQLNRELDEQRTAAQQRARDLEASEAALQRQTDLLQAILDGMGEGVIARACDGGLLLTNPAARRILPGAACDPQSALATFTDDYESFLDEFGTPAPLAETPLSRALSGISSDNAELYLCRRSTGENSCLEISARPLRDQRGGRFGAMVVFREITGRKRAERELAERTRDLERSNVELEQFAYSASHDLQEPLRMVTSYVQLLRDRYRGRLDSDADDFIDFAVDGAVRMKQLINDLLLYSRAGRGHASAAFESAAALDWAVANLALKLTDSGAVVIRGTMPPVMADASQLGQLFQNLIDNALKFHSAAPPRIEIGAERRDGLWEFCVRDNGIGVDQQHAARIFQMFQRLHSTAEYPGTGIGLAVCRKIVERNGGSIWVDSEAHPGTAFRFTIPAVASAPGLTAKIAAEQI